MTISVIIPALNEEKYLPICLRALRKQTKKPFETIVIDNGSTDRTPNIAHSFGAKVIFEPKCGIIPARQKGFRQAQGEIIARTDADSQAPPFWIAEIEKTFKRHPKAAAVTGPIAYRDASPVVLPLLNTAAHLYPFLVSNLLGHPVLAGANFALKRNVAREVKPHLDDSLVHEDIDLSCHVVPMGKIIYNPKLFMRFSARRIIHNPKSFFGEYPIRFLKTLYLNHSYLIGPHRRK